jgi:tRNA(Ser,Leu) C12 N-acetylase TAN1
LFREASRAGPNLDKISCATFVINKLRDTYIDPTVLKRVTMAESGKKRRFHYNNTVRNPPKRGAKGILLTCEAGRENKCKREGLEILKYDWETTQGDHSTLQRKESKKLTLDEEIAVLNDKSTIHHGSPFTVYETGCRGTVFILYTAGVSIPEEPTTTESNDSGTDPISKRAKVENANETGNIKCNADKPTSDDRWDPVKFVVRVVEDMNNAKRYPSSRFITRIIPIQATSFSSIEDIKNIIGTLVRSIIDATKDVSTVKRTFAIIAKRRLCDHLSRDRIIEAVGKTVSETAAEWKVDLNKPDYRIIIEVCKNIAGASIVVAKEEPLKNFNVAELREKLASSDKTE